MLYEFLQENQTSVINDWFDNDNQWNDLSINKKIGPRIDVKRKVAKYLCIKKKKRKMTKSFFKQVIAKYKKIYKSLEKKERHLSKQIIKETDRYTQI